MISEAANAIGISPLATYKLARTCGCEPPNTSKSENRGKNKTKYTQEQKNTFFQAFDRLQSASAEAREIGFPQLPAYNG